MSGTNRKGFSSTYLLLAAFILSTLLLVAATQNIADKDDMKIATPTTQIPFGTTFKHVGLDEVGNTPSDNIATIDTAEYFHQLINEIKRARGTYGIYIKHLDFDQTYTYNEKHEFYAASLYKTPVAAAILKQVQDGRLSLNQETAGGITLDKTLQKLLKHSDNPTQIILENLLEKADLHEAFTQNLSKPATSIFYTENISTPKEIADYFENLYEGDYLDKKNRAYLLETISSTGFDNRISTHLDQGLYFAHKIGNWPQTGSWHDCGIIYGKKKLVVCVMSERTTFDDFLEVGKAIADFINLY